MRIVSWNVGHQTTERPLKPVLLSAIAALAPDILVLNEFVDGATRTDMKRQLTALGLGAQTASTRVGKNNQVFIASRGLITTGPLKGPATSDAAISNFFHVETQDLSLIALRVPAYSGALRSSYWRELTSILTSSVAPRAIVIGDLNADPENGKSFAGRALRGLGANVWQLACPAGEWSYCSSRARTRIDHALLGSGLTIEAARYMPEPLVVVCAGLEPSMYDHAPLVVDFH